MLPPWRKVTCRSGPRRGVGSAWHPPDPRPQRLLVQFDQFLYLVHRALQVMDGSRCRTDSRGRRNSSQHEVTRRPGSRPSHHSHSAVPVIAAQRIAHSTARDLRAADQVWRSRVRRVRFAHLASSAARPLALLRARTRLDQPRRSRTDRIGSGPPSWCPTHWTRLRRARPARREHQSHHPLRRRRRRRPSHARHRPVPPQQASCRRGTASDGNSWSRTSFSVSKAHMPRVILRTVGQRELLACQSVEKRWTRWKPSLGHVAHHAQREGDDARPCDVPEHHHGRPSAAIAAGSVSASLRRLAASASINRPCRTSGRRFPLPSPR